MTAETGTADTITADATPWAGRHARKDATRRAVWAGLQEAGVAVGRAIGSIPHFAGADLAAWHLARTPAWGRARNVKVNPDAAQIPVRLHALLAGKTLYMPVPRLAADPAYLRLDPARLAEAGVSFELAATAQGALQHGEPVDFAQVAPLDLCVFGAVAVTRAGARLGKGAGFADIETGLFHDLGRIGPHTVMATTVHDLQLCEPDAVPMEPHDTWLGLIATPSGVIGTGAPVRTTGLDRARLRRDQIAAMPVLRKLSAGQPPRA